MSGPEWVDSTDALETQWEALADRVGAAPWLRPGWFRAWMGAFGEGSLACLVLRENDGVRALVPVLRHRAAIVSPTNWHSPGFCLLAEDAAARRALVEALLEHTNGRLALSFLGAEDARVLRDCAGERRTLTRVIARSPYVELGREALSKNTRRNLRRARRRLASLGDVALEIIADEEGLEHALEVGFAVEAAGWKGRQRTAISSDPKTRRFYEELGRWSAARGTLRLFLLRVEGQAVAFEFGLQEGKRLYDLKGGFDERFARASPGTLITEAMLRYGTQQDLSTLEFLGDAEQWKLRWATGVRECHQVQVFGRGAAAAVQWIAHAHARPLARKLRSRRGALIWRSEQCIEGIDRSLESSRPPGFCAQLVDLTPPRRVDRRDARQRLHHSRLNMVARSA